jgi:hypothetical protein
MCGVCSLNTRLALLFEEDLNFGTDTEGLGLLDGDRDC